MERAEDAPHIAEAMLRVCLAFASGALPEVFALSVVGTHFRKHVVIVFADGKGIGSCLGSSLIT